MQPSHVWTLMGALLGVAVVLVLGIDRVGAQPGNDLLEPGVLAPMDEPDYGVIPWEARLEPGVLSPSVNELEPGLIGQGDPLFARPVPTPRCAGRCADVLEPGVIGRWNELEPGLIGQGDPLFR